MKLYFLTGLPTETDEDTLGIAELARRCVEIGKKHTKGASVTVSVGGFVPKPFTPFQWFGQNTVRRAPAQDLPAARRHPARPRACSSSGTTPRPRWSRASSSRGDRRLGPVIEDVWRAGGTFQEWSEHFDLQLWLDAMDRHGLSIDWYVYRHRTEHEVLPWDHLSAGLHKDFLWQDWRDALDRARPRGLPLDPVLRLRRLHRLRHRARRGLGHAAGRRQPGHRPGREPCAGGRRPGAGALGAAVQLGRCAS